MRYILETSMTMREVVRIISGLEVSEVDYDEFISSVFAALSNANQIEQQYEQWMATWARWPNLDSYYTTVDGERLSGAWKILFQEIYRQLIALNAWDASQGCRFYYHQLLSSMDTVISTMPVEDQPDRVPWGGQRRENFT